MTRTTTWGWTAVVCAAVGCFSTSGDDNGNGSSSGGQLVACTTNAECADQGSGATCNSQNVCVDEAGTPIRILPGGSGEGGTDGSGTGGGGATGGSGGAGGSGGTGGSGGSGGGSADAGTGTVLPDCMSLSADGTNSGCAGRDDQPVPECCDGTSHMRCEFDVCTASFPAMCSGMWAVVPDSTSCGGSGGGYEPCAGKLCGDACTICAPDDTDCVETAALKFCAAPGGTCSETAVTCEPPTSCNPNAIGSADVCADGEVCCAVGRCGPVIISDEGICEPADKLTGECMPCACDMQPGGCPICASPDTPIATPSGERPIATLREGDLVLSVHEGEVVAVPIARIGRMAAVDHAVVRLVFDDGSAIEVSGSHPTADGRRLDALAAGDVLGEARVATVETVPYLHGYTYDILPASDTGTYFAGGAWLGSTLH